MSTDEPITIGSPTNFWLFSPSTNTFDLTHPSSPNSPSIQNSLTLQTTTSPIKIDPSKSALVIIDMQNFFLANKPRGPGHDALDNLVEHAIPAARKAGIRIVWLNWGLTEEEVRDMPPGTLRAFGFAGLDRHGKKIEGREGRYVGLGNDMGVVRDPGTGEDVQAGKMLMRDQWNTALFPPLDAIYQEGKTLQNGREDVWIYKNCMSGLWGASTACEDFLQKEGIKTLLFAGVNTDQCVGGTFQDAYSKGYDCVLVSDGAGTTSPEFAQKCVQWNAENTWGFVVSCKGIAEGVEGMGRV